MRVFEALRRPASFLADLTDRGRSLVRFRTRVSQHVGTVRGGDAALSMLYIGNGSNLPFMLATVFGGRCESRQLGVGNVWRGSALARDHVESADMTVFDLPWPWEIRFGEDACVIEIPAWVRQAVVLPAEREAFFAGLHRSVRGEQMRKIRKNGLSGRLTRDEQEIRRFYRTMYAPHVRNRFGADATVVPETRVVKYARQGALLQVVREGQVIAGSVLYRRAGVVQSLWSGFDGADLRALDGATAALFYHLVGFAFDHGCRVVDYCGSRPLLTDGVFETKRRWGAAVHDDWSLETLLLQFNRFDNGVRQLLCRCPWITRHDGALVGKLLVDDLPLDGETVEREERRLASGGLGGLHLYALAGIREDARHAIDRCAAPVTLFDLGNDDRPLTTYCNR
jgi:hypothetical protein